MPRLQAPPVLSSHLSDSETLGSALSWARGGCFTRQQQMLSPGCSWGFKADGDSAEGESEKDVTERRKHHLTKDSGKHGGPGF